MAPKKIKPPTVIGNATGSFHSQPQYPHAQQDGVAPPVGGYLNPEDEDEENPEQGEQQERAYDGQANKDRGTWHARQAEPPPEDPAQPILADVTEVKRRMRRRPIWTGCLGFAWIMCAVTVLLTHLSVAKIHPPIRDLTTNVLLGFQEDFKFKQIEVDGQLIMDQSTSALQTCYSAATGSGCSSVPTFDVTSSSTLTQWTTIDNAFDASLSIVFKVAEDKCLGASGFDSTASNLRTIQNTLNELEATASSELCAVTWPKYCAMYVAGEGLKIGATEVNKQIDDMVESDAVKKITEYSDNIKMMHGLPYVLVASLAFFTLFWAYSGAVCCCCRGGKCLGCILCAIPHFLLWLMYVIISSIVVGIGFYIPIWADDFEFSFSDDPCTISELIDHIETEYSAFYTRVLKDLIDGMISFHRAFVAAALICFFIGGYAYCICVCRPYSRETGGGPSETE
jgi:hypothetical protein